MNIVICTEQGQFVVEVDMMETVLNLKHKLNLLLGVPVSQQTLSIYGCELVDELEMEFYQMNQCAQIDLSIKPPHTSSNINIYLRLGTTRISLLVNGTKTVAQLKEEIHRECSSVAPKRLTLFFSGMEMDNHCTLNNYGVTDYSELVAVSAKPSERLKARLVTPKRLNLVVETASSLNSMDIPVAIEDSCRIGELRMYLVGNNLLPKDDYFFIHRQRILNERQSLSELGVKNGDHLHVFQGSVVRGD